jgi:hypothetical protein
MEVIRDFWNMITAGVLALAFVIRMEMAIRYQSKELLRLERQQEKQEANSEKSRSETHDMLKDMNAKLDRLIERNLR